MTDPSPRRSREHALVLVALLAAPLVLLGLGRALEPDPRGWGTHEQLGFRPCTPMTRWNVPCPGCGVTTALALSARGAVPAAFRTQPLGPLLVLASLAAAGWALAGHRRGRDLADELAGLRWRFLAGLSGLLLLLAWLYKLAVVRGWP
ncbi:MAG TPA: DUF2752 domain-containing protein [Planctomycetota bacterium]